MKANPQSDSRRAGVGVRADGASCQSTLVGSSFANFLSSASKNAFRSEALAGMAPYVTPMSGCVMMKFIARTAASACNVDERIPIVSACSFAVVLPSSEIGATAMSQSFTGVVLSPGYTQHVYQVCTKSMATLPDWNVLPPARA